MSAGRHVVEAGASSGKQPNRCSVRVVRYADGWDVFVGIGPADPARPARATARLDPEGARALAGALMEAAAAGEVVRAAWTENRDAAQAARREER